MDTLFVSHFLDGKPVPGEHSYDESALHVNFLTHAVYEGAETEKEFLRLLEVIANRTKGFDLLSKELTYFGENQDVPVFRMFNSPWATRLHTELLDVAESLNLWLREPQFNGEHFVPHVSVPGFDKVKSSKFVPVDHITVLKHVGAFKSGTVQVLATFDLKRDLFVFS